jgi:hypothetical protein
MIAWFFVWGSPEFVVGFLAASAVISVVAWKLRRIDEDRTAILATKPPKPCRKCGEDVSQIASHCPHCGVRDPAAWEISRKTGLLIIAAIFGLPMILAILMGLLGFYD